MPYLKQEELPHIPREEPPCPALQYVLCAATSPATKQQEEALTYLNQGTLGLGSKGALNGQQALGAVRAGVAGTVSVLSGIHTSSSSPPRPVL